MTGLVCDGFPNSKAFQRVRVLKGRGGPFKTLGVCVPEKARGQEDVLGYTGGRALCRGNVVLSAHSFWLTLNFLTVISAPQEDQEFAQVILPC